MGDARIVNLEPNLVKCDLFDCEMRLILCAEGHAAAKHILTIDTSRFNLIGYLQVLDECFQIDALKSRK